MPSLKKKLRPKKGSHRNQITLGHAKHFLMTEYFDKEKGDTSWEQALHQEGIWQGALEVTALTDLLGFGLGAPRPPSLSQLCDFVIGVLCDMRTPGCPCDSVGEGIVASNMLQSLSMAEPSPSRRGDGTHSMVTGEREEGMTLSPVFGRIHGHGV